MDLRQRRNEDSAQGGASRDAGSGEQQQQWHQEGDAFLAAGEDAIQRALSTNATTFLHATRQQGGE